MMDCSSPPHPRPLIRFSALADPTSAFRIYGPGSGTKFQHPQSSGFEGTPVATDNTPHKGAWAFPGASTSFLTSAATGRWPSRGCAMFEEFKCRCIYVEFSNASVPRSGRVEYRAKLCDVCRAREALSRLDQKRRVALAPIASRYQGNH
jgi:hypothetical protein